MDTDERLVCMICGEDSLTIYEGDRFVYSRYDTNELDPIGCIFTCRGCGQEQIDLSYEGLNTTLKLGALDV